MSQGPNESRRFLSIVATVRSICVINDDFEVVMGTGNTWRYARLTAEEKKRITSLVADEMGRSTLMYIVGSSLPIPCDRSLGACRSLDWAGLRWLALMTPRDQNSLSASDPSRKFQPLLTRPIRNFSVLPSGNNHLAAQLLRNA